MQRVKRLLRHLDTTSGGLRHPINSERVVAGIQPTSLDSAAGGPIQALLVPNGNIAGPPGKYPGVAKRPSTQLAHDGLNRSWTFNTILRPYASIRQKFFTMVAS